MGNNLAIYVLQEKIFMDDYILPILPGEQKVTVCDFNAVAIIGHSNKSTHAAPNAIGAWELRCETL